MLSSIRWRSNCRAVAFQTRWDWASPRNLADLTLRIQMTGDSWAYPDRSASPRATFVLHSRPALHRLPRAARGVPCTALPVPPVVCPAPPLSVPAGPTCDLTPRDLTPRDLTPCDITPCDLTPRDLIACDVTPRDLTPCDMTPRVT